MEAPRQFRDRTQGGEFLAQRLLQSRLQQPVTVLALPRGGLPTGLAVARSLQAPLDIVTVRKIGLPANPEFAVGAVAAGVVFQDEQAAAGSGLSADAFAALVRQAQRELQRREVHYRQHLSALDLTGQTAVVVDDGLATGATMLAAVQAVRARGARRIIVAAPVASQEAAARLRPAADDLVFGKLPATLRSVGEWYQEFDQVTDQETLFLLEAAAQQARPEPPQSVLFRSAP